jgi:colanic acid biosynthesis glycosyl transferase WcaI
MPHVLFFNRSYHPDLGATGQLLTELCEDLVAKHGWEVTVVAGLPTLTANGAALPPGRGLLHRESIRGVTVLRASGTRLSKRRFAGRAANYVSYFASACLAPFWARRPDVVVSLTDPPILGLAALAWAKRWRVPFAFFCHDVFPEVARLLEDFRSPGVERLLDHMNRFLIRHASGVVALGETMKDRLVQLREADPAKVAVIHNWGDRAALGQASRDNAFARQRGLLDRFVVMHSGNIGLSQGLEILVDAAALLVKDCPDVSVVFVGDGARRAELEGRAHAVGATNVRFFPYQPKEELQDSFGAADVFVISLKRGLTGFIVPSKLYGYLAAGKPYVAAVEEDSEVTRITRQYASGLLVEPGDAQALADRLRFLYRNRDALAALAAGARRAAEAFNRPIQVRAYHDLLASLVNNGRV